MLIGALSLVIVGLGRDLDELLAQVDLDRPVDDRDQEHRPGPLTRRSFVLPSRKTTSASYCLTTRIDRYRTIAGTR